MGKRNYGSSKPSGDDKQFVVEKEPLNNKEVSLKEETAVTDESKPNTGAVIGVIIGLVIVVCLVGFIVITILRLGSEGSSSNDVSKPTEVNSETVTTATNTDIPSTEKTTTEKAESNLVQSDDGLSGYNSFAKYTTDKDTGDIIITPSTDTVNDNTVIPGLNVSFGALSNQFSNVPDTATKFNKDLFKDFLCVFMYQADDSWSKDSVMEQAALAAEFSNNLSDYDVHIKSAKISLSADDETIEMKVSSGDKDAVLQIKGDMTYKLSNDEEEYCSGELNDDNLSVWYIAIEELIDGNVYTTK